MATIPATRRHDLTDRQWTALQPLLPVGKKPGRPPKWSKRRLIDAFGGARRTRRYIGLELFAKARMVTIQTSQHDTDQPNPT